MAPPTSPTASPTYDPNNNDNSKAVHYLTPNGKPSKHFITPMKQEYSETTITKSATPDDTPFNIEASAIIKNFQRKCNSTPIAHFDPSDNDSKLSESIPMTVETLDEKIEQQSKLVNRIKDKIRDLEDAAYDNKSTSSKTTSDTAIRHILAQQAIMIERLDDLDINAAEQTRALKDLISMKDKAYIKIAEVKYEMNQFQDEVERKQTANEKIQLKNRQNINDITYTVKEHSKTQRKMLSTLEDHGLKLNATGTFSATSPWALTSDAETYPILRSVGKQSHFSALPKMLDQIFLDGDDLSSIQHFYDAINAAIMTTLSSNKFLPDYADLSHGFDHILHLLPTSTHTQYNDALNIYKNMSRTLLRHLHDKSTINTQKATSTALILQENNMVECGFDLLFMLVTKMSPQLGGYARDLELYVTSLKISDGEPVLDYYLRALRMFKEIQLQQDSTGQNNRLIRRFVTLLFTYAPFMECLRPVMTIINAHFLRPNNHLSTISITLQNIYNHHLKEKCAPITISRSAKYSLPSPQISMLHTDIQHFNENEDNLSDTDEQENCKTNNDELASPTINAARFGKQTSCNRTSTSTPSKLSSNPYNPTRCKVCGMTQKECHLAWNSMHDPNDPTKCCFRGPIFNPDKHIRETVLQYNLKHPEAPNHSNSDKEDTPKTIKTPLPPDLTEISTPPPKCAYSKMVIPSEKHQPDHPPKTSSEKFIHQENSTSPQKETIDSLIKYIENMETNTSRGTSKGTDHTDLITTPKVFMSKIQDGHLMRGNHIIKNMFPNQCQPIIKSKGSSISTYPPFVRSEMHTTSSPSKMNIHVPKVSMSDTIQPSDDLIKPSMFYRLQE